MKKLLIALGLLSVLLFIKVIPQHLKAATPDEALYTGFRQVEAASVADAEELLYGQKMYMSHNMRPLFTTKFAGPATTVLLQKQEHTEGSKALSGMLDAIDEARDARVLTAELQAGNQRVRQCAGAEAAGQVGAIEQHAGNARTAGLVTIDLDVRQWGAGRGRLGVVIVQVRRAEQVFEVVVRIAQGVREGYVIAEIMLDARGRDIDDGVRRRGRHRLQ